MKIIVIIDNNYLGLCVYNKSGNSQLYNVLSYININDNKFRHITWVINGGSWDLYLDGESLRSLNIGRSIDSTVTRTLNYIGKSNSSGNPYFNGQIYDFRCYYGALSTIDVKYIYDTSIVGLSTTRPPTTNIPTTTFNPITTTIPTTTRIPTTTIPPIDFNYIFALTNCLILFNFCLFFFNFRFFHFI